MSSYLIGLVTGAVYGIWETSVLERENQKLRQRLCHNPHGSIEDITKQFQYIHLKNQCQFLQDVLDHLCANGHEETVALAVRAQFGEKGTEEHVSEKTFEQVLQEEVLRLCLHGDASKDGEALVMSYNGLAHKSSGSDSDSGVPGDTSDVRVGSNDETAGEYQRASDECSTTTTTVDSSTSTATVSGR